MDYTNPKHPLGIDFSIIPSISDNLAELTKPISVLKNLIKIEQDKIKQFHRSGAGGREVVQVHTSLIDSVICHLVEELAASPTIGAARSSLLAATAKSVLHMRTVHTSP